MRTTQDALAILEFGATYAPGGAEALSLLREELERGEKAFVALLDSSNDCIDELRGRLEKAEAELADLKKKYEGAKYLLFGEKGVEK